MHDNSLRSVLSFGEVDRTQTAAVGGKGANLGELSGLEGIPVPAGFCVTTAAFRRIRAEVPSLDERLSRLSELDPGDREGLRTLSAEVRQTFEQVAIPRDLAVAVSEHLAQLGEREAYAVRSSATAEDLPTASFAGQQDTYLNVVGLPAILERLRQCWASLFTERAVTYRLRNRIEHRRVEMAVVVQRMASAQASGVLFTADPLSGNRTVSIIEAVRGLGEAFVSGRVNADVFHVRGTKLVQSERSGGSLDPARDGQALTPEQAVRLAQLGRRIEAHFGAPQDIEWCLVGDDFQFVQSRPITTLFPVPQAADGENHVYVSVGHNQMMTDPMSPLGLSLFQLIAAGPMVEAGARLWVDVTRALASPASRGGLLEIMGRGDPLVRDALQSIVDRGDFIPPPLDSTPPAASARRAPPMGEPDATLIAELVQATKSSIASLQRDLETASGAALLDLIRADIPELKRILFEPRSSALIMAGMRAIWWLSDHLRDWLGERTAVDALTQSVPNNVTSEMGLALMDVADAIRPHPEVVAFLQNTRDEEFVGRLSSLPGGPEAQAALSGWLAAYGMRGVGEIDLERTRWSERPTLLLPMLLGNIKNFAAGAGVERFEQGRRLAEAKEQEILGRLHALPDGEEKVRETKRMIDQARALAGYREYPKYGMVCRLFVYKQALLAEAKRLAKARVLREPHDLFFLTFPELQEAVRATRVDDARIARRREALQTSRALTPPRVLTSDGEMLNGTFQGEDCPPDSLPGLAVSAGIVEGRARIIRNVGEANLEPGDILVTTYTDPSWTPIFVAIRGLVTEVGGLMTHGSVIAREYGLPAVVGVAHATERIQDGQAIRVNGTAGYVEILSSQATG